MPEPKYRKYYANNGIVAYAQEGDTSDLLFVWSSSAPKTEPDTLALQELFSRWGRTRLRRKSGRDAAPAERALYFCQKFDLRNLAPTLDKFSATPDLKNTWGKLVYWGNEVFVGDSYDILYPNGESSPITTGEITVLLEGVWPSSLDDFTITLDTTNMQLSLGFGSKTKCRIYKGNDALIDSNAQALSLPLVTPIGFVAGAVGVSVPWPQDRNSEHPLRMAGFLYQAGPAKMPPPGEHARCPSWRAQLADEVSQPSKSCLLVLDPRDAPKSPQWLANGNLNSRLGFSETILHSSFFGTKGQRFHLQARGSACARLGFVFDRMTHDGTVVSAGAVIFHPEGPFAIVSPSAARVRGRDEQLGIGKLDLIAGAAATEFFDLEVPAVKQIEFVAGQPAFFTADNDPQILENKKATGDKSGRVVTSFLTFTGSKSEALAVTYQSEPVGSPLFESIESNTEDLTRRRIQHDFSVPMPLFPWAGYKPKPTSRALSDDPIRRFEVTHLAQWRRQHVTRRTSKAAFRDVGGRYEDSNFVVTPQGVLAEVTSEGYTKLLFGNSDSSNQTRAEFSITITGTNPKIFQEVQRALAASQVFLVFDQPEPGTLHVINPTADIHIREFSFSVKIAQDLNSRLMASQDRTVLIIKYFKGKTLAALVKDKGTWGCQAYLAPKADSDGIEKLAHSDADPNKPIPPDLEPIWNDPDWQGVLLLNPPKLTMPDILESLSPGIVGELRAHHLGLNALPVLKTDLAPGGKPRLGSAFGLIKYTKPQEDPKAPDSDDHEPGAQPGAGDRKYSFIVQSLEIGFQNSQVSSFAAEVDITFSHLFWDKSTVGTMVGKIRRGQRRKLTLVESPVKLFGTYERRVKPDGGTEDVFGLRTNFSYTVNFGIDSYLESLTLSRAQLSVVQRHPDSGSLQALTAFIGIDADIKLREKNLSLPLFKVKAIHLLNFGFQFVYKPNPTGADKRFTFGFKADGVAADIEFDLPSSSSSVLNLLPLKLKGMTIALGKLLDFGDIGFQSIGGIGGTQFHFGFVLELDLGFLGKLAGDLKGLRVPMILGWRGGENKGVAFGVQFPTFEGKLDIGIQQFVRLRADQLNLVRCPDSGTEIKAFAIQLVNAKLLMFGKEFPPDVQASAVIIIPVHPSRRASWALGVAPDKGWLKFVGAAQRIAVAGNPAVTKEVVFQYRRALGDKSKACSLLNTASPETDGWTIVAQLSAGGVDIWLAVSDAQGIYGLVIALPALGEIDVLYRRVNDQLGIFSAEYTLPAAIRNIQMGAATVRLPTFRIEVHTDGGFLFDFGFPWNNEFSRSAQVEIAIFLGSGGFYYGRTSAAASDLLQFTGGYGYGPPDPAKLTPFKALRLGFAARVGVGRSFSIGILTAEASLTIFGGLEGAAAYPSGGGPLLDPTLYALKGFVGLMLDIRAQVSFAIIQARARLLAYALVGIEIRRVLAKKDADGAHYYLTLPTVIYAEIGLTVSVDVQISVGCVSITIHLSFSTTWRLEETLGSLIEVPYTLRGARAQRGLLLASADAGFEWKTTYRYWADLRDINIFVTVLPCMADATDVGGTAGFRTCVVGQMLLPVEPITNGFGDYARFLVGWVLRPDSVKGIPDNERITLQEIAVLRKKIKDIGAEFWVGFQAALTTVVSNQFSPVFNNVRKENSDDAFATMPFWPGTVFQYAPKAMRANAVLARPHFVTEAGLSVRGDDAGFANYASCMIMALLAEFEQLITSNGHLNKRADQPQRNDPNKFLTWGEIWSELFATLT